MNPNIRVVLAYIGGSLISKKQTFYIQDRSRNKEVCIEGVVTMDNVKVFEYGQKCFTTGEGANGRLSLHHHGDNQGLRIKVEGNKFEGTTEHPFILFNGTVNGNSITLYDSEEEANFEYTI
jgi:hypothetical protein